MHDLLPDIILKNQDELFVRISIEMTGRKLLLLCCPDPRLPDCRVLLEAYARQFSSLELEVHLFVITGTEPSVNIEFLKRTPLPFMLLSDSLGRVAQGLDIRRESGAATGPGACTVVLADENRRIVRIDRNVTEAGHPEHILNELRTAPRIEPRQLSHFAPVLYLPRVLERDLCETLIAAYDSGDTEVGRVFCHDATGGDHIVDRDSKIRKDFYLVDPALQNTLILRLVRRVFPEIAKGLTRQVTGVEEFKVVCYDAEDGGHFAPHRDNNSKFKAHRRFAMTLNLNEGYAGGALRFPEFGPDLYAPAAGDAVIFSCSLLHEALPVTAGRRYVLLSFLFDEESRQHSDRFRRPDPSPAPQ